MNSHLDAADDVIRHLRIRLAEAEQENKSLALRLDNLRSLNDTLKQENDRLSRAYLRYEFEAIQAGSRLDGLLKCREALVELCQLKHYKDDTGKDAFYREQQPKAWARANEALNATVERVVEKPAQNSGGPT